MDFNLNPFSGRNGGGFTDFLSDIGFRNSFNPFENLQGPLNELGFSNSEAVDAGQNAYDEMLGKADANYAQNQKDLEDYYAAIGGKYGGDDERYRAAIEAYLNSKPVQVEDFSYSGDVSDFMDPAAEMRAQNAMTAINNAAGADGSRFSSDFLNRQAAKQQTIASEEWEKAYQRLMNDRNAQLQQWQANSGNARANQSAQDERLKAAMQIFGEGSNKADQAYEDFISGIINNRGAQTQTSMDAVSGKTDLGMNQENGVGGAVSSILKAIFG